MGGATAMRNVIRVWFVPSESRWHARLGPDSSRCDGGFEAISQTPEAALSRLLAVLGPIKYTFDPEYNPFGDVV